jgi:hypothetical protein
MTIIPSTVSRVARRLYPLVCVSGMISSLMRMNRGQRFIYCKQEARDTGSVMYPEWVKNWNI